MSSKDRDELYQNLLNARDFVESSVYDAAKYQAVHKLEDNWVRFLKEDLKAFLELVFIISLFSLSNNKDPVIFKNLMSLFLN